MSATAKQLVWRALSVKRKAFTVARQGFEAGEPGFDVELLCAVRAEYVAARAAFGPFVFHGGARE